MINLIDKTNAFLKNLNNLQDNSNSDELTADLNLKTEKYPLVNVKRILDNLI